MANKNLQRNEILAEGEIINAYASFSWGGRFLGTAKLREKYRNANSEDTILQAWIVDYISCPFGIHSDVNGILYYVEPTEPIISIGDNTNAPAIQ